MVSKFLGAFKKKKLEIKFHLASMQSFTNFKNLSRHPLQRACCGIQKAASDS
jgi:hypothetical protein